MPDPAPRVIRLRCQEPEDWVEQQRQKLLDHRHYDLVISGESVDVYKPDGSPLLKFRHRVLLDWVCRLAYRRRFEDGVKRVVTYLAQHHEDEYNALVREFAERCRDEQAVGKTVSSWKPTPDFDRRFREATQRYHDQPTPPIHLPDFVEALLVTYKQSFNPMELEAERQRLASEHDKLYSVRKGLTTPRMMEKADKEIAALETRMDELDSQCTDLAQEVADHYRYAEELCIAIADAHRAIKGQRGERAMRQMAQALRVVIQRIECSFEETGHRGGGWNKKNAQLTTVTIYPVIGKPAAFSADSKGTLLYSSAHSCIYRTCTGRMR